MNPESLTPDQDAALNAKMDESVEVLNAPVAEHFDDDTPLDPNIRVEAAPAAFPPHIIASVVHEANRQVQLVLGEPVSPPWGDAPDWMRESTLAGVNGALAGATPEESHQSWMRDRIERGWVYGPVKNEKADPPTHPCLVEYRALPDVQRAKDRLLIAITEALRG